MDAFSITSKVFLLVALIAVNGFFVAAEFALVKIRASQLETLIQAGSRRARYAKQLIEHMDVSLSVTQLGVTLSSLGLGWLGEPVMAMLLSPLTAWVGLSGGAADTLAFFVAFSLITAFQIVLGELAPKNIAIQRAETVMLAVAMPLLFFQRLTYPFVWLLNHVANWVVRHMGFEVVNEGEDVHSEDEIRILMEESHKYGYINKTEYDFVDNVFDFSAKDVRDIMLPRTDMICLYLENSIDENIRIALRERLTRYPICREDKDDIIGFLHIKDLLEPLFHGNKPNLRRLARPALVVPETMTAARLLKTMQKARSQLAIVADEYGGTAGMVTIEDVVEEIVGDIQDEFDQERPVVEKRGEYYYSIDARLLLEEVNEILELNLTADNVDTIGGWLYAQVETPPRVGQKVVFEDNEFLVEEIEHVRITRVLVKRNVKLQKEHEEIKEVK